MNLLMAKVRSECLHCSAKLPLFLKLKHADFCSDEHRAAYYEEQQKLALQCLIDTEQLLARAKLDRSNAKQLSAGEFDRGRAIEAPKDQPVPPPAEPIAERVRAAYPSEAGRIRFCGPLAGHVTACLAFPAGPPAAPDHLRATGNRAAPVAESTQNEVREEAVPPLAAPCRLAHPAARTCGVRLRTAGGKLRGDLRFPRQSEAGPKAVPAAGSVVRWPFRPAEGPSVCRPGARPVHTLPPALPPPVMAGAATGVGPLNALAPLSIVVKESAVRPVASAVAGLMEISPKPRIPGMDATLPKPRESVASSLRKLIRAVQGEQIPGHPEPPLPFRTGASFPRTNLLQPAARLNRGGSVRVPVEAACQFAAPRVTVKVVVLEAPALPELTPEMAPAAAVALVGEPVPVPVGAAAGGSRPHLQPSEAQAGRLAAMPRLSGAPPRRPEPWMGNTIRRSPAAVAGTPGVLKRYGPAPVNGRVAVRRPLLDGVCLTRMIWSGADEVSERPEGWWAASIQALSSDLGRPVALLRKPGLQLAAAPGPARVPAVLELPRIPAPALPSGGDPRRAAKPALRWIAQMVRLSRGAQAVALGPGRVAGADSGFAGTSAAREPAKPHGLTLPTAPPGLTRVAPLLPLRTRLRGIEPEAAAPVACGSAVPLLLAQSPRKPGQQAAATPAREEVDTVPSPAGMVRLSAPPAVSREPAIAQRTTLKPALVGCAPAIPECAFSPEPWPSAPEPVQPEPVVEPLAEPAREEDATDTAAAPETLELPSFAREEPPRGLSRLKRLILTPAGIAAAAAIAALLVAVPAFTSSTGGSAGGSGKEEPGALSGIRKRLAERAGVKFVEKFQSGFDHWDSPADPTQSWKFDDKGFVVPGQLAVYKPSAGMSDYQLQFLGQIEPRSLNWAFRIQDFDNYYAARLVIVRPGPLPRIDLQRYAVIDGKEMSRRDLTIPLTVRGEMIFQVRLDAKGPDFVLRIQDKIVDAWTDSRIPSGGIGFFNTKGERSRISWLEISHQYDVLGRICAYLSPSPLSSRGVH